MKTDVGGMMPKGRHRKTWEEAVRKYMREMKVTIETGLDRPRQAL